MHKFCAWRLMPSNLRLSWNYISHFSEFWSSLEVWNSNHDFLPNHYLRENIQIYPAIFLVCNEIFIIHARMKSGNPKHSLPTDLVISCCFITICSWVLIIFSSFYHLEEDMEDYRFFYLFFGMQKDILKTQERLKAVISRS